MINAAYNTVNNAAYSISEALPSQEAVSSAFSEGVNNLFEKSVSLKNFLYDVLFVDLQDMELSKAAEYRTYKIAAAVLITIASLATGAYLAHSAYLACFMNYPNTLSGVLSVLTHISLPIIGSGLVPALGTLLATIHYVGQVQEYDAALQECKSPQENLSLRESLKRETLEKEIKVLQE